MALLIAGVLVWSVFHIFKRVMPATRAAIDAKIGAGPSKGIFALIFLASIVMMVFGFTAVEPTSVYTPPSWGQHLNNLLMLISVFLLGAGSGKGKARTLLRHPMLAGVIVWAAAHLIANGDTRDIVLFGGLAVWAIVNMLVINMREGKWDRPVGGPLKADIKTVIISLVIYAIIAIIHYYIGPAPFGG